MVYESDITNLLNQWQNRTLNCSNDRGYKDGLNDCIYDLRCLIDKNFAEEALANEAFEQQLKEDAQFWEDYRKAFLVDEGILAV